MQRDRTTALCAVLGLGACASEPGQLAAPGSERPPSSAREGVEPSGLGTTALLAADPASAASKPGFVDVPRQFCTAELRGENRPLLRTESFLHAWNELARAGHGPVGTIPTTEFDAQLALCGQPPCSSDAARVVEVTVQSLIAVGVLIPGEGGMLVVPDVAPDHPARPGCPGRTEATAVDHGSLIHLQAISHDGGYNYSYHYYSEGHGYGGGAIPGLCTAGMIHRRDLIIDARTARIELSVVQSQNPALGGELAWVELAVGADQVVLTGCRYEVLELQWTPGT